MLFGALGTAGCSGDGDDGGSIGTELGARYCALFAPCCQAAGYPATNQNNCKLFFSVEPKDKAAGEACIAEYEQRAQAADWCDTLGSTPRPVSCDIAYPETPDPGGSAKPGEACQFASDCATPAAGSATCYDDTCRTVVSAASGQACVGTKDGNLTIFESGSSALELGVCDSAQGLYCNAGTCVAIADLGGACSGSSYSCVDGTYCGSGTCKAQLPAGSSCQESYSACDDQSYCEFLDRVCVARVPDGSPCDDNEQCLSMHCDYGSGACAPPPSIGNDLLLPLVCN